ncbi:MAG: hypothetical protein LBQ65_02800, partial [Tannerellaceae bacterium]|nr:hypothetical protein [Tannerellaceae bacterium]
YTEKKTVSGIKSEYENQIMKEIIDSINKYLSNNKGAVSDYHLIKDIVDRNCDAAEEEINTQIPVPLYCGLMGTMLGILIGVGFLVIGGGLSELLGNTTNNSTGGIETLMGGVALAMISSISGILLTTMGSSIVKDAKATVERNKNTFLSWIQSVLLPYLSSNTVNTLEKLTRNLAGFNTVFSSNTKELKEIFDYVNESYRNQAEVVKVINSLKIKDIANANILVYDKLKNCTEEIGRFSVYLQHVNEYIANVKSLNEKLDQNEARAIFIEEMGAFFKEEINQIEARKGAISKSVGTIDATLQDAFSKLKENTDSEFNELNKAILRQQDSLEKGLEEMSNNFTEAIKRQQNVLETRLETTSLIVDELKNLTAVKTSMDNLEKATTEQNRKIDTLSTAIKELAEIKAVGNRKTVLPSWLKVSVISGVSILGISFLLVAAWIVLKLLYDIQL